MAITTSNCPARCLDVTRLVSRVGRGQPTGIDRVEMAYLLWLLRDQAPLFVMARLGGFFFVLDQAGVGVLLRRLRGRDPWGSADWKSAIHRRLPPEKRQVLTDLRKLSIGRARDRGARAPAQTGTAEANPLFERRPQQSFRNGTTVRKKRCRGADRDFDP